MSVCLHIIPSTFYLNICTSIQFCNECMKSLIRMTIANSRIIHMYLRIFDTAFCVKYVKHNTACNAYLYSKTLSFVHFHLQNMPVHTSMMKLINLSMTLDFP